MFVSSTPLKVDAPCKGRLLPLAQMERTWLDVTGGVREVDARSRSSQPRVSRLASTLAASFGFSRFAQVVDERAKRRGSVPAMRIV